MNDHDQLREQMWDLVYDLVTPEEKAALEGRIKSDPKVARLYAEVSLEADLISQAAKVADTSVTLPQVQPRREKVSAGRAKETAAPARGAGISRSLQWLAALAASALAVVLTVGTVGTYWQAETVQPQEQLVISIFPDQPGKLVASVPTRFRIETKDPSGKPASATITAQLADAAGASLYEKQVQTDSEGKALFSVPGPAVAVGAKLKISRAVQQQIESPPPRSLKRAEAVAEAQEPEEVLVDALLPVEPEPIKAPAMFDKDQYTAGEEAQFRVVPQNFFSGQRPDISTLAFRLQAPDGRLLEPTEAVPVDGTGIVAGRFQLPANAPPGRYEFKIVGSSQAQPQEEAGILVAGGEADELRRNLLALDTMPAPSFAFEGGIEAGGRGRPGGAHGGYGGGKPPEARETLDDRAMKLARLSGPKGEAARAAAGAGGAVPAPPGEPAQSALAARTAPSPGSADKTPSLERELAQTEQLAAVKQFAQQRQQMGLDGKETAGTLDVNVPAVFAGKPVKIEAYYNQILLGEKLVAAVEDESRDKATEVAPDGRQSRTAAIPLDPWLDGEKVDLLFRDASAPSSQPVAQREEIPSLLNIALAEAKDSYAPGEKVRLLVEVKNRFDGLAVPNAALGVVVKPAPSEAAELMEHFSKASVGRITQSDEKANQAIRSDSITQEDHRVAMARRKVAVAESIAKKEAVKGSVASSDSPHAAAASAPAPVARDAATPDDMSLRLHQEREGLSSLADADGSKSLDFESASDAASFFSRAPTPVVISNEAAVQKALEEEEAARSARQAQIAQWRSWLGRLLLALGVVMLLALGLAFALQRPAKAKVWIPALGIAIASFAVGLFWLQGQPGRPGHEVAQAKVPAATDEGVGEYGRQVGPAAVPPESEVALMADIEEQSNAPAAGPQKSADKLNETNGVGPRGGAMAGAPPGSAGELGQRTGDRQLPRQQAEGHDRTEAKSELAPADQGGGAPTTKAPSSFDIAPAQPGAPVKEGTPKTPARRMRVMDEGEKKAAGDVSESSRKPTAGRGESNSLSEQEKPLTTLAKRVLELFKDDALADQADADSPSKYGNEVLGKRDAQIAAVTGVWQPLLEADENGRAVIEFTMPEAPGDYRLVLDVSGLGHVGQLRTNLRCAPLPAAPAAPAAKP